MCVFLGLVLSYRLLRVTVIRKTFIIPLLLVLTTFDCISYIQGVQEVRVETCWGR